MKLPEKSGRDTLGMEIEYVRPDMSHIYDNPVVDKAPPLSPKVDQGEVLVLTDDLSMVLGLRQGLLPYGYDLTWTNNFWVATSYIESHTFCAFLLDFRVQSVEFGFVANLMSNFDSMSNGKKIVLGGNRVPETLKKQLLDGGAGVFDTSPSATELIGLLELGSDSNWFTQ